MHDALLFTHFLGLMMGAGGGFASMLIARRALKAPPEQAGVLRSLGPMLARLSTFGLVLMLASGLGMALLMGGFSALPTLFWAKFAFVTTLTLAAVAIELTYAQVKAGNLKAAANLPKLGPVAGISSLLAVLFAVLTFH
jgi:hypothetical protein